MIPSDGARSPDRAHVPVEARQAALVALAKPDRRAYARRVARTTVCGSNAVAAAIALLAAACGVAEPEPDAPLPDPRPGAAAVPVARAQAPAVVVEPVPAYDDALAQGRSAFAAKDFAKATEAFERALAASPGDARALSELGWAAFNAGDLARAESVLREATAKATADPKIVAASWYNLGRVHEAKQDIAEAIVAYQHSLALRENRTVRERLGRLQAPPASETFSIAPLVGPNATIEAWCAEHHRERASDTGFVGRCEIVRASSDGKVVRARALANTGDLLEAAFVLTNDEVSDLTYHHLALRTAAGWFVGPSLALDGDGGAGNVHFALGELTFETLELVPGGGDELMVRVEESFTDLDMGVDTLHDETSERRVACGIGRSGTPSCTSPIPLRGRVRELVGSDETKVRSERSWRLRMHAADGAIVLAGDDATVDPAHRAWIGNHAIAFR
jgi:tetratricopeptide (TPR) repeat protein